MFPYIPKNIIHPSLAPILCLASPEPYSPIYGYFLPLIFFLDFPCRKQMPQRDGQNKPFCFLVCSTRTDISVLLIASLLSVWEGSCSNWGASAAAPPQGAEDPNGSRAWGDQSETSTAPSHVAVPTICRCTRPHPTETKLVSEGFCKMHNTVVF